MKSEKLPLVNVPIKSPTGILKYKFCLFVDGNSPNSVQAQINLMALCETYLPGKHEIEVIDVLKVPMLARKDDVLMTPTLLMLSPTPIRRIVGALSNIQTVLKTLGLGPVAR